MKIKNIVEQLIPGCIVGLILGFTLSYLVGVNATDPVPNYIGSMVCCALPTFLNSIVILKGTAKTLKREISIKDAIIRALPFVGIGALIGIFFVAGIMDGIFQANVQSFDRISFACVCAVLGIVVQTILGYFVIVKYVDDVKYTRRKKKA